MNISEIAALAAALISTISLFVTIRGKKFEIIASWNELDDWFIDVIDWIDDIGTEDDEADVIDEFYSGMQS